MITDQKTRRSRMLKVGFFAILVVFVLALCACVGQPDGEVSDVPPNSPGASPSSQALDGSMMAVHDEKQLKLINGDWSKKSCLSCHPRDTITAATKDYGDAEGYNPHAAHTESYDCGKCHSIEAASVLVCNEACHGGYHGGGYGWPLPEKGWQDPTPEMPSADGTSV